jgi:hypothetical protein
MFHRAAVKPLMPTHRHGHARGGSPRFMGSGRVGKIRKSLAGDYSKPKTATIGMRSFRKTHRRLIGLQAIPREHII